MKIVIDKYHRKSFQYLGIIIFTRLDVIVAKTTENIGNILAE